MIKMALIDLLEMILI
ncbi:unnamed protein product, partial [Rotaria magnacalcarata]